MSRVKRENVAGYGRSEVIRKYNSENIYGAGMTGRNDNKPYGDETWGWGAGEARRAPPALVERLKTERHIRLETVIVKAVLHATFVDIICG